MNLNWMEDETVNTKSKLYIKIIIFKVNLGNDLNIRMYYIIR